MVDIFRPLRNPAALIYDAFQNEAKNRGTRIFEQWNSAEISAVWRAARDWAQQNALRIPTLEEISIEERCASGHVDYGSKWAYGVARLLEDSTHRRDRARDFNEEK